ncbi:MAG TPA: Holliday junction branch migration protein RuvA [Anaerolineaceae bacterium]|nr:Holliday junction branch migration protein RuvA [Anaerolineaceae bacterium]HPN51051.1 Holliday junction branch migration protein RuvA [Anaerolineaceae bacterium]
MIASLFGEITEISSAGLVVRVGGVGLLVSVPAPLRARVKAGETISLHTYLVVREDALSLYGFDTAEEREFFVLLLGVNGVGPRTALATLSVLTPDAIRRAVVSEQADLFAKVPGVGKKTGQKILLQLQGKIQDTEVTGLPAVITNLDTEVLDALTGLGYSVVEAQTAIQAIPHDAPQDVEARLRLALQYFR